MSAVDDVDARPGDRGRRRALPQLLGWAALAGIVAAGLAQLSASEVLRLLGLPDPGAITTYGVPAVMAFGETAAVVMVGSLLLAAVLVPPQSSGVLDVDGYLAVRTASVAAAIWAVCAALLVPLTLSDSSGQSLGTVFADPGPFFEAVADLEVPKAWAWTCLIAVVVAAVCRLVLRHKWAPTLLLLAVASLMPRALSGHSASGGSHDIATNSLVFHIVAAALWMGGLVALVLHVRRRGQHLDVAARRFSAIAVGAYVIMAVSGVVNAAVRVPVTALVTSTYGVLILAKVAALVLVGLAGWRQRTVAVTALEKDPQDRTEFTRLAVVESVVLSMTIGIAVALGRTPPPAGERREPTPLGETLGYDLGGAPSPLRLMIDWRFDLIFGAAAILLAATYLLGVRRLRRDQQDWPVLRTVSWVLGCAALLLATSSGVGRFAPAVFSVHMGAVAALAIIAPLLLVLGAPFTLFSRTVCRGRVGVPGMWEWSQQIYRSAPVRFLTHPAVAFTLFIGGFYVFYLGGLYDSVGGSHFWHVAANAYFVMTGFVFFWVGVGSDPAPHRTAPRTRLLVVVGALAAYACFLIVVADSGTVIAAEYYTTLRRGWFDDLAADQRLGAAVGLMAGALPLVAAAAVAALRIRDARRRRPSASMQAHVDRNATP
ncbi:bifunctional copper resistance protein CopD/cytochrome c oxidase assembly protein (plasmid) [Rhodococcus pseudokoreensis]|uniref:Bifunctional copper resistance protein CopD/cytochrome c oxidase assembly protein n=1 Tax=Rhodococcus pseudokoreensis TaxID=2811421 RepID=A0A974ZRH6_9NOCA|nr:cytochrome c oxidase assembly protein [Rhodococcus pseudokoreensis]QSE87624.1 bifunctional copper resistance protein CopD/cytochrome c oxidase assembly protein [Rhodococcus pseudokoreensis]